jgi:hypothetical protein
MLKQMQYMCHIKNTICQTTWRIEKSIVLITMFRDTGFSDLRVPELMHLVIYFVEHIVYVDSATTNPVKRAINSR